MPACKSPPSSVSEDKATPKKQEPSAKVEATSEEEKIKSLSNESIPDKKLSLLEKTILALRQSKNVHVSKLKSIGAAQMEKNMRSGPDGHIAGYPIDGKLYPLSVSPRSKLMSVMKALDEPGNEPRIRCANKRRFGFIFKSVDHVIEMHLGMPCRQLWFRAPSIHGDPIVPARPNEYLAKRIVEIAEESFNDTEVP